MAVLPDKILTEQKIEEFIDQANTNAKNIVGDSKFTIPDPSLPGTGLLIKLWIRQAEKSFSSYFVPILAIKEVLNNPLEIPGKIGDISGFIENPLQAARCCGVSGMRPPGLSRRLLRFLPLRGRAAH